MSSYTIKQCLQFLAKENADYYFKGNENLIIEHPSRIDALRKGSFGFYRGDNIDQYMGLFNANNLAILKKDFCTYELPVGNYIFTCNPQLAFIIIAKYFEDKVTQVFIKQHMFILIPL